MVDQWRNETARTPIIGFISTWPVYQGTTIDRYAHSLIQGISAAANEQGYSLLIGMPRGQLFQATAGTPLTRLRATIGKTRRCSITIIAHCPQ